MVLITLLDHQAGNAAPAAAPATALEPGATPGLARAFATSNVRTLPDPTTAVIAILPGAADAELLGRTADSAWLQVAYPAGSTIHGWLPASRLQAASTTVEALPVRAAASPAPLAGAPALAPAEERLPDLEIASVFLLQDGRVSVDIVNRGEGTLLDTSIPLHITGASGEILGVLEVGPTTLLPNGSATVVTPVRVTATGTYLLQLDRADSIRESQEANNSYRALLVAGGG